MKSKSEDLRRLVLLDFAEGMNFAELGRRYRVSAEWVRQFIRRHQATGEIAARPRLIRKLPFHRRHEAEIRRAVADNPGHTLESLRTALGREVSVATLWTSLRALKISFKKKRSSPPNEPGPTSPRNERRGPNSNFKASTRTASSSSTKPGSKPT